MPFPAILGALGRLGAAESTLGRVGGAAFNIQNIMGLTGGDPLQGGVVQKAIPAAINAFSAGLRALQGPLTSTVDALGNFHNAVTGLGGAVSQFTKLANPALTQRFQFASDDLAASIGRGLIPVLTGATKFTRMFADIVFALSGPVQRLGKAFDPLVNLFPRVTDMLSPFIDQVGKFIDEMAVTLRPVIESGAELAATGIGIIISEMTREFIQLATVMKPMIALVAQLAKITLDGVNAFAKLSGGLLSPGGAARAGLGKSIRDGSVGAAVRNATIGSVESYQQKAFVQAFSLGTGASKPEDRIATSTENIYTLLQRWVKSIEGLTDIAGFIDKLPSELADAIRQFLPGFSGEGGLAKGAGATPPRTPLGWATQQGQRIQDVASGLRHGAIDTARAMGLPVPPGVR